MKKSIVELSKNLQSIANELDKKIQLAAGERLGFTLLVYTDGRASYISNCDHQLVISEMKNLIEYFEAGMPDIPAHQVN